MIFRREIAVSRGSSDARSVRHADAPNRIPSGGIESVPGGIRDIFVFSLGRVIRHFRRFFGHGNPAVSGVHNYTLFDRTNYDPGEYGPDAGPNDKKAKVHYTKKPLLLSQSEIMTETTIQINSQYDRCFIQDRRGRVYPIVCSICDRFVMAAECTWIRPGTLLDSIGDHLRPQVGTPDGIRDSYVITDAEENDDEDPELQRLQELILSPRAFYSAERGLACCIACKNSIDVQHMPRFAINNCYFFGTPPDCLTSLTEVELAFITPVKTHGYCFSFTGGLQKQLKGSLSYFKVDMSSIARATVIFDVLGFNDPGLNRNVCVILHGKFTLRQHQKAKIKSTVRPDKILEAVRWLSINNSEWKERNIDLGTVREAVEHLKPVVIERGITIEDDSSENENQDSNIEETESFQIFFPDGTNNEARGGQTSFEEYKNLAVDAIREGYSVHFVGNMIRQACRDFQDNNLVNACLLQFPYGRGGIHESRSGNNVDVDEYIRHLSMISQPHFQSEMFTLILYNMYTKQRMLRSAQWSTRNKMDVTKISCELKQEDVILAIRARSANRKINRSPGQALFSAIDTIASGIPHTNIATRRIRKNAESLTHYFGIPCFFLTITPDDDNSFFVFVYADQSARGEVPLHTGGKSTQELFERFTQLRLKFPGISALYFQAVIDIVFRVVLGFDKKSGEFREHGFFRGCKAFSMSVEEQGRRSLHAHFQIWTTWYGTLRDKIIRGDYSDQAFCSLNNRLQREVDHYCSTALFGLEPNKRLFDRYYFPHDCSAIPRNRKRPSPVTNQQLRNLRHRAVAVREREEFATCPRCKKQWTNEQLVNSFAARTIGDDSVQSPSLLENKKALKLRAVEYQSQLGEQRRKLCKFLVPIAYDHHVHNTHCFKIKRKRDSGPDDKKKARKKPSQMEECRYRVPNIPSDRTHVEQVFHSKHKWYRWDGSFCERNIHEIVMKRHEYDSFQNTSCPAIGHSKFACNTNLQPLLPGPLAWYVFKYNHKYTQEDDTEEYRKVSEAVQRILSRHTRRFEKDRSECLSRVLSASFAHQSTNIVGGPMAAYLLRNGTRYEFSHQFAWCPLADLKSAIRQNGVTLSVTVSGGQPYFRSLALDYICRPRALESLSPFEYYSRYYSRRGMDGLQFIHEKNIQHPSYRVSTNSHAYSVYRRDKHVLITIHRALFPDTGMFGGSILDPKFLPTENSEAYCEMSLLLFGRYRRLGDITIQGSFTRAFYYAVKQGLLAGDALTFLQNLQDSKYNSNRVRASEDKLQRLTDPFSLGGVPTRTNDSEEESEEDDAPLVGDEDYEQLVALLEEEPDGDDGEGPEIHSNGVPITFHSSAILKKGTNRSAWTNIGRVRTDIRDAAPLVELSGGDIDPAQYAVAANEGIPTCQTMPDQSALCRLLFRKTVRRNITLEKNADSAQGAVRVDTFDATGSPANILRWSHHTNLDSRQRTAFEIFAATFVLSFIDRAKPGSNVLDGDRLEREIPKLLALAQRKKPGQLICFLHGPGGSGKTTVIDLFVAYARKFCDGFGEDYRFTKNTICITALTGVAATLLLGDTTYRSCFLNQARALEAEQFEAFADTIFVVVDEISFAGKEVVRKLHEKLRDLKGCDALFGGLHVIFAGDMRQLEPVGHGIKPLYEEHSTEFDSGVNRYIELNGRHRFRQDPEWGGILSRFREGTVTVDDIRRVNTRVVGPGLPVPNGIKYAVFQNRDRDAINTALFLRYAAERASVEAVPQNILMVFASGIKFKKTDGQFVSIRNKAKFFSECGENDIKFPSKATQRMDPVLRLFVGCEVMLTSNTDVASGMANGTTAIVDRVILKDNEIPFHTTIEGGVRLRCVTSDQIEAVRLRHLNERIKPELFLIRPETYAFVARFTSKTTDDEIMAEVGRGSKKQRGQFNVEMKASQLPFVINNATTGHKLQGASIDEIYVHVWNYRKNWPYVVLSRVRKMEGLFMRQPLQLCPDKFGMPEKLDRMIRQLRSRWSPTYRSDRSCYPALLRDTLPDPSAEMTLLRCLEHMQTRKPCAFVDITVARDETGGGYTEGVIREMAGKESSQLSGNVSYPILWNDGSEASMDAPAIARAIFRAQEQAFCSSQEEEEPDQLETSFGAVDLDTPDKITRLFRHRLKEITRNPERCINRYVAKKFDCSGWFRGTVQGYTFSPGKNRHDSVLFRIRYDDDDEEDLSVGELAGILIQRDLSSEENETEPHSDDNSNFVPEGKHRVAKYFPGHGWFFGTVCGHRIVTEGGKTPYALYKITYDDGDEEEFTEEELQKCLCDYRSRNKEVGNSSNRTELERVVTDNPGAMRGRRVAKFFDAHGWFYGTVDRYEGTLFRISYDDGDFEDYEAQELINHLLDYAERKELDPRT